MGSVTTWRGNPVVGEIWESDVSMLTDPVDPAFVREFQASTGLPPALLETVVAESLKVPAHVWRAAWHAIVSSDYSPELGKIQAPTLIVWGDQDPLCPRDEQEALTAAIAGSRLALYPGFGHNPTGKNRGASPPIWWRLRTAWLSRDTAARPIHDARGPACRPGVA